MALTTDKITLPTSVATTVIEDAKNASTIAALSPASPQLFTNTENIIFRPQAEAEVVGETGAKSSYEQTTSSVPGKIVKVQTTTRVSSELRWADEDARLQIITSIQADQSAAVARAIDYVVYHAINPKTGAVMPDYSALSATAKQVVAASGDDASASFDELVSAIIETANITGVALSPVFANSLRKLRVAATGQRLYDIPLSLQAGNIEGTPAVTSRTVNGAIATVPTNVLAFAGDYSLIRWGMVRNMVAEIIEFGSPDGGEDLKHTNEIAYRTEAAFAYAVLDPNAFAVLKSEASGA